ncbi:SAP domain protein [Cryptosporidium meleagridis]|uniref:SAP domain protein n=1 Tax=Cryptosporidium meleagridis TaxID=93969 RepID=A0A2P4YXJ7_9CRYT|nr:SAP domain protein [Cryptosporidium meleagridis]
MNYNTLKIDELKELLKERGLSVTGRKQQLVQALIDYDSQNNRTDSKVPAATAATSVTTEKEEFDESMTTSSNEVKTDQGEKNVTVSEPVRQTICISDVNQLSEKERIELRRQKFGACVPSTEAEKRLARSKRFGATSEDDKRKLRQERFGMISEADKIKNRRERFGTMSRVNDPDYEKKIQARKLRFGLK